MSYFCLTYRCKTGRLFIKARLLNRGLGSLWKAELATKPFRPVPLNAYGLKYCGECLR